MNTYTLPEPLEQRAGKAAALRGIPVQELISDALEWYLAEHEPQAHILTWPGDALPTRRVVLIPDEGGFLAEVPSLPGCFSQGDTVAETLANIREAIELYTESLADDREPVPNK